MIILSINLLLIDSILKSCGYQMLLGIRSAM